MLTQIPYKSLPYSARSSRRRGFTLVEVLVSVVILSMALIALSQLYLASVTAHRKAQALTIANARAQMELERVLYLGSSAYEAITNAATPLVPNYYPSTEYTALAGQRGVSFVVDGLSHGAGTVVITPNPFNKQRGRDAEDARLARAVITVSWQTPQGKSQSVILTTYLAQKPETGGI